MKVSQWLARYGIRVLQTDAPDIRSALVAATAEEGAVPGQGDTEFMKLCSIQLFGVGNPTDSLLIWRAKTASMDSDAAIDIQLLCGAGLPATKVYLESLHTQEGQDALDRIAASEAAGDFDGFAVEKALAEWESFYH